MKVRNVLPSTLAALACFGTLTPHACLQAADVTSRPGQHKSVKSPQTSRKISDIELDQQGRLLGVLVDENGKPEALKKVEIRQGKRTLAVTRTDRDGRFQVSRLRGGVYQIASGDQSAVVRVWSNGTAPPKSKSAVLLVTGKVTRGQGFIPMNAISGGLGLGAGIAGLTIGIVNMDEINDLEEENSELKDELDRLENSLR